MLKNQSIYYGIFAFLFIIAFLLTIRLMKKQESKEIDDSMSRTTVKHKLLGNIGIMLFVIAFLVWLSVLLYGILYYS